MRKCYPFKWACHTSYAAMPTPSPLEAEKLGWQYGAVVWKATAGSLKETQAEEEACRVEKTSSCSNYRNCHCSCYFIVSLLVPHITAISRGSRTCELLANDTTLVICSFFRQSYIPPPHLAKPHISSSWSHQKLGHTQPTV